MISIYKLINLSLMQITSSFMCENFAKNFRYLDAVSRYVHLAGKQARSDAHKFGLQLVD